LVTILKEPCENLTVEEVLNRTLECALEAQQNKKDKHMKNGEDWKKLDEKFSEVVKKIAPVSKNNAGKKIPSAAGGIKAKL
jgi:hypothetical protein